MIKEDFHGGFRPERVEAALDYWDSKRGGRSMPSRRDIDPAEIVRLLPGIVLVDVLTDPADFRFRLMGTAVRDHAQADYTGKRFSELWPDRSSSRMWADYRRVVAERQPLCTEIPYAGPDWRTGSARHLLMPLSDDDRSVTMVFGLVEHDHALDAGG